MFVISDVDGTIVDPGMTEGPRARQLFRHLTSQGVGYGFASSRSLGSLADALPNSLHGAAFAICSDGALTLTRAPTGVLVVTMRALLEQPAAVLDTVSACTTAEHAIFVFLDDRFDYKVLVRAPEHHDSAIAQILGSRSRGAVGQSADVPNAVMSVGVLGTEPVVRAVAVCVRSTWSQFSDLVVRVYPEVRISDRTDLWWCDVSSARADKGQAFASLLTSHEYIPPVTIPPVTLPIVVLGDGENDLVIASHASIVLCPPWAHHALQEVAMVLPAQRCEEFLAEVLSTLTDILGA